jgi:hypothetical protein
MRNEGRARSSDARPEGGNLIALEPVPVPCRANQVIRLEARPHDAPPAVGGPQEHMTDLVRERAGLAEAISGRQSAGEGRHAEGS